jgi:hypothetical protein
MQTISVEERRRRLARRHHLAAPVGGINEVAADLVGLHSSDPVTVYLSAWARVDGLSVEDVDLALYDHRSLLRMLGMRRTMFVVPRDLATVMDAACTRGYAPGERRRLVGLLEDQLVDGDGSAWLDEVLAKTMAALEHRGQATARELTADVPELGRKIAYGQGTFGLSTRILFLLATERRIIRARPLGTWKSSQYRWTPLAQWVPGGLEEVEREDAIRSLVERWLRSFGPGTLKDLTWWTGWTVADARSALEAVKAVEVELTDGIGYVLPGDEDPDGETGEWVALLPGLDPTVMGWKERAWYLNGHGEQLFDTNGNAGPTVWWNGSIVGGWAQRPDGEVVFELVEEVSAAAIDRIAAHAERLTEWLGGVVVKPRFATPLEKRLRS